MGSGDEKMKRRRPAALPNPHPRGAAGDPHPQKQPMSQMNPISSPSDRTGLGGDRYLDLFARLSPLVHSRDPREIGIRACELINELLDVEACSLMLRSADGRRLELLAATHIPAEQWPEVTADPGEGLAGEVLRRATAIRVTGRKEFLRRFGREPDPVRYPHPSCMMVPVMVRERAAGVINVANPVGRREFLDRDAELLSAAASLVGGALSNADLTREALRLHHNLEEIFDSMEMAALAIDEDDRLTHANQQARQIFGLGEGEIVGRTLREFLPDPLLKACARMIRKAGGACGPAQERLHVTLEGTEMLLLVTVTPIRGMRQEIGRRLIVIEDVSEQEEILRLREAEQAKHNFMAIVSHELRTPLTVIKGALPLIDPAGNGKAADKAMLGQVHALLARNCKRLNEVVNSILDVTEIENDTLRLTLQTVDLHALLGEVVDRYRAAAEAKRLTFEISCCPGLPPIEGDRRRLAQALAELIGNAVKFSDPGESIGIRSCVSGAWIEIGIANTGAVIDPAARDEIFKKFRQGNASMTRTAGGCGLGLFLAQHLLRLHGGQIVLADCQEKQTTFVLRLPLKLPEAARARAGKPASGNDTD